MLGFNPTDKFKLWAGGIATLVIIGGIFAMAWIIRDLQTDNANLTTALESEKALSEYRSTVIESRNDLIAAREKSAAANRNFLARQAQLREGLKNDADVDPAILGPDYFNSLQRPR